MQRMSERRFGRAPPAVRTINAASFGDCLIAPQTASNNFASDAFAIVMFDGSLLWISSAGVALAPTAPGVATAQKAMASATPASRLNPIFEARASEPPFFADTRNCFMKPL